MRHKIKSVMISYNFSFFFFPPFLLTTRVSFNNTLRNSVFKSYFAYHKSVVAN